MAPAAKGRGEGDEAPARKPAAQGRGLSLAEFERIAADAMYIRLAPDTQELVPAGGPSSAVAPASFGKIETGAVSDELSRWSQATRHAFHLGYAPNGEETACVLLNSVAGEANRIELALEAAARRGAPVPDILVDFSRFDETRDLGKVGALRAPHRGFDALLRDSLLNGRAFMESDIGKSLIRATRAYATPLLTLPHMLLLGAWHTQGGGGGRGVKFPRALKSEIVGYGARPAVSAGGRCDPVGIEKKATFYRITKQDGTVDWTSFGNEADKDKNGDPIPYPPRKQENSGRGKDAGSPSLVNHGPIMPVAESRRVTIKGALHDMVLSLPTVRALEFPDAPGTPSDPERDRKAHTALAALGLFAMVERLAGGYCLRSGCDLIPLRPPQFQIVGRSLEDVRPLEIDPRSARSLFEEAVAALAGAGLPWGPPDGIDLEPDPRVRHAIVRSRGLTVEDDSGE